MTAPALILDFDNTITTVDVGDAVADRFGDPRWRELDRAHHRGEVALQDLLRYMFESMRGTEAEVVAFAREVGVLRPGFSRLLRAARRRGAHLVVASGGLDLYILPILGEHAGRLEIVANRGWVEGDRIRVDFPNAGRGCGRCGNCKAPIVEDLRARGFSSVVVVGDGTSDLCMARVADRVFARDALAASCKRERLPFTPFTDFDDVRRALGWSESEG
jgi:2-hydroxy-3-keto-5-methylthiopentenyl-1-phosphate phosphatase